MSAPWNKLRSLLSYHSKPLYTSFPILLLKRGMAKTAILGILAIFLISLLAVIYVNTLTGAVSSNAYGSSKLYGGGLRRAYISDFDALSKKYSDDQFNAQMSNFMYSNKDQWECTFGPEAEKSGYPCVYDEQLKKYCCITKSAPSGRTISTD